MSRARATIIHKGELTIPRGNAVLRPADEVLADVHAAHLNQLAKLLGRTVRALYDVRPAGKFGPLLASRRVEAIRQTAQVSDKTSQVLRKNL